MNVPRCHTKVWKGAQECDCCAVIEQGVGAGDFHCACPSQFASLRWPQTPRPICWRVSATCVWRKSSQESRPTADEAVRERASEGHSISDSGKRLDCEEAHPNRVGGVAQNGTSKAASSRVEEELGTSIGLINRFANEVASRIIWYIPFATVTKRELGVGDRSFEARACIGKVPTSTRCLTYSLAEGETERSRAWEYWTGDDRTRAGAARMVSWR